MNETYINGIKRQNKPYIFIDIGQSLNKLSQQWKVSSPGFEHGTLAIICQ